jgi:hypothetical protein
VEYDKIELAFDEPARYRICVRGLPLFDWTDRLGGLTITPNAADAPESVTVLEGWMPDQAALSGALNTLYEMHLSLISVEALSDEPDSSRQNAPDGGDSGD